MGSVANQKVSSDDVSVTIDYTLGGPLIGGRGSNQINYQRTFIRFTYSFDPLTDKFVCTTNCQTGVADDGISFFRYIRFVIFGEPDLKVSKRYFDSADELIDDFGARLMDGVDGARKSFK